MDAHKIKSRLLNLLNSLSYYDRGNLWRFFEYRSCYKRADFGHYNWLFYLFIASVTQLLQDLVCY